MPFSTYLPEHMGSIRLTPPGPFVAGSLAELTLVYTAGTFGIDDTGMVKISWRTTSDMAKPQFDKPQAANFTTVEASNGAKLEVWYDRLNIRPYVNTLLIRVGRGYLRQGDTLTIRFGDRRQGSPGWRLQTNVEKNVELKTSVDAFATYEFCELPAPAFDLVSRTGRELEGDPAVARRQGRAVPAGARRRGHVGQSERQGGHQPLASSPRCRSAACRKRSPSSREPARSRSKISSSTRPATSTSRSWPAATRSHAPIRCASSNRPTIRRYWADLHGQSGETVGMGSAEDYFRYARDAAFVDMVGHQGNDFQITDAFWKELNRLTAEFDEPGKFVCLPGYEWSGNTGMGGDRNVFYRREGRPIRRSSHILVQGQTSTDAIYTADKLFDWLKDEDCRVIAHVGGRYADLHYAHDGRVERSVEVHSSWGTFEWLLHDAFEKGFRVGVVCHSDDHKGRPGATRPGASTFGAIGGLSCYFMPELTRDALFEALRKRWHYGTTGSRIFLDLRGAFAQRRHRIFRGSAARSDGPNTRRAKRAWATSSARARSPMTLSAEVDRHRAGRTAGRAARNRTSCKRYGRSPPAISAAACACSGRAPNIAAAAAKSSGRAS